MPLVEAIETCKSLRVESVRMLKSRRLPSAAAIICCIVALAWGCITAAVATGVSTNAFVGRPPLQIVTCRKGVDMEGLIHEHGLFPKFRYRAFNSFAAPMPEAVIQKLKADSRVMFVEADGPVALCGQTNGFGLTRIGIDHFPPARINGSPESLDVDVAIMDTGIDPHQDLPPSYVDVSSWSVNTRDEVGHGTEVAGVIAALDNDIGFVGVAPGVRIWNIKAIGPPPENSWSNIASAMDYLAELAAVSNQVSVVNMSFVNKYPGAPVYNIHYYVQQLVNLGIVVVAGAGNEARDLAGEDGIFGTGDDAFPASFPEAMAVSAMDSTADQGAGVSRDFIWRTPAPGVGSNFSQIERTNGGSFYYTNYVYSPGGAIDVAAPGVNILTTLSGGTNGYAYATGTSLAAPHVTGLVALYIATHGRATNAAGVFAIRQAIINAALPQSQWQPHGFPFEALTNNTADPDTHPEPLAIASESLVSPPFITQTAGVPGNFQLQFATVPGYDYTLQSTTDLTQPIQWTDVGTRTGANFVATVLITDSNAGSQSFYQIKRSPSP